MSALLEQRGNSTGSVRPAATAERSIGRILLDAGLITAEGAEKALRMHRDEGIRFGEACVRLGLVTQADIQEALSNQFDYPYLRSGTGNLSAELVAAYAPFSRQVEALRALRTQLLLRWFSQERKVLSVISPSRGDGRSFVTANLAIVFSQLGERTLLVDADLRAPRQHRMFNLENRTGLSVVLGGRGGEADVSRVEHFANLSVLTAGPQPPNPVELISRTEFQTFLDAMAQRFDVILIDTSAASSGADAQTVSMRVGGAMLLVRDGRTRVKDAQSLSRSVSDANAEIVGCVVNKP